MKGIIRIIISFVFICSIHCSFAQNHHLDSSFGAGGTLLMPKKGFDGRVNDVAIQNDGKIVFGGYAQDSFNTSNFSLIRCNADGSLDTTFGVGGTAIAFIENRSRGQALALQNDGKIIMGGWSKWAINLARYTNNGTLDSTFGEDGKVITNLESYYSERSEVLAIQNDGKILVAGYGQHFSNDQSYSVLLRYTADGQPDSSFGTNGQVIGNKAMIHSMLIQNDGKIVLAGTRKYTFYMTRYHANGTLDSSFGTAGEVLTTVGLSCEVADMALQSDGKIILAGNTRLDIGFADFALARYHGNGDLDQGFGVNGISVTSIGEGNNKGNSVLLQDDGKILVAGEAKSDSNVYDFAAARFNSDGSLDQSFGTDGKIITPIGPSSSRSTSVGIQKDGKLVLGGYGYDGTKTFMILARYNTATATGIGTFSQSKPNWFVYPNPFQSTATVHFQSEVNNAELSLYNCLGQCVMQVKNVSGTEYSLSRDSLPNGIYYLHLKEGDKQVSTQTLVID